MNSIEFINTLEGQITKGFNMREEIERIVRNIMPDCEMSKSLAR